MRYRWIGGLAVLLMGVAASGQVLYMPVQYQFNTQNPFYYGGTDPDILQRAAAPIDAGGEWGRVHGFAFISGDDRVHREVVNEPLRVFSDALPTQNAHLYGYTVTDAANAANASVSRYFRKADVVAAQQPGRRLIVPAQAPVSPINAQTPPTTRPVVQSAAATAISLPK